MVQRIRLACTSLLAVLAVLACTKCRKMDMSNTAIARTVTESNTFVNPLSVPPVLDGTNADLTAQPGTASLGSGVTVNALGYGVAPILGPTIRINQGEQFNLAFSNNLAESTNIHWHGLEVPASQDGYPTDVTIPGGTFQYGFPVKN